MAIRVQVPAEKRAAYEGKGYWRSRIIVEFLDEWAARQPDKALAVEHNTGRAVSRTLTYRQVQRLVRRVAAGFAALGIRKGDVVSFQLPNWWEALVVHYALASIGAVTNPLMPIFRARELRQMLGFAEARAAIVPASFRGFDHAAMFRELRAELPTLEHVFVIGGPVPEGCRSFEESFLERDWERTEWGERAAAMRPDPNDAAQLMFTSGTTGEPKGVVHTHNTLLASVWPFVDRLRLGSDDVMLMGSPIAHQTGFVYGMLVPCVIGGKAVYMDVWNAAAGLRLMEEEGVTISMGATPFLADIVNHPDLQRYDLSRFRTFVCGGAPIPRPLVEKSLALGIRVSAAWGMTENGVVTLHELDDPAERIASSDGKPQPGMELKVVDAEGRELPRGEEGRLLVRGPFNFIEYLKRPELTAQSFDAEGFFDTGDLARMDEVGYIRITGRSKDIIIRGGENIPVVEVENLLYRHPKVQDAAVVAMPDPRLGERACAYVVPKPGETFTFQEMVAYLEEQRMARQYFPERLEIVAEMPRTPSGKIQKFKLREDIRQKLAAESGQAAG